MPNLQIGIPSENRAKAKLLSEQVNDRHILNIIPDHRGRERFCIQPRLWCVLLRAKRQLGGNFLQQSISVSFQQVGETCLLRLTPALQKILEQAEVAMNVRLAALVGRKSFGATIVKKYDIRLSAGMFQLLDQSHHFLRIGPTLFAVVDDANRLARLSVIARNEGRDGFRVRRSRSPHHRISEHPNGEGPIVTLSVKSSANTLWVDGNRCSLIGSPPPEHVLVI